MADPQSILKDYIECAAHVGFVVEDMQEALLAASRVYGISAEDIHRVPESGESAATHFAFFTVGALEFEYIQPVSEEFREILLGMSSGGGGINHIAWRVSDIAAAVALLADNGIQPGHVTPDGIVNIGPKKMVYLDPATTDGLVIELLEYPTDA